MRLWFGVALLATVVGSGCTPAGFMREFVWVDTPGPASERDPDHVPQRGFDDAPEPRAELPPLALHDARPGAAGNLQVWQAALDAKGERIVVSLEQRRLWLMEGDLAVLQAPVAVGRDTIFHYKDQAFDFSTPTGVHRVMGKEENPLWVPPNWHYYEKAVEKGLEVVYLAKNSRVELSDGTFIEVRDGDVGRINQFGNWWPFTAGGEIIFDDTIFIPPIGSPQRRIDEVLGTHRLILGDGYLIHGTPDEDSIGSYASHGCVRMFNHDVEKLYGMVEKGIPVFIY